MATVGVSVGYRAQDRSGQVVPVMDSAVLSSGALTSSDASSTTNSPTALDYQYWMITPLGDVWVKFGAAPTATAGGGPLLAAGGTYYFKATAGDKVAVLDAS